MAERIDPRSGLEQRSQCYVLDGQRDSCGIFSLRS